MIQIRVYDGLVHKESSPLSTHNCLDPTAFSGHGSRREDIPRDSSLRLSSCLEIIPVDNIQKMGYYTSRPAPCLSFFRPATACPPPLSSWTRDWFRRRKSLEVDKTSVENRRRYYNVKLGRVDISMSCRQRGGRDTRSSVIMSMTSYRTGCSGRLLRCLPG
jgi:hypothetical protein